jgi:hypothetical protein
VLVGELKLEKEMEMKKMEMKKMEMKKMEMKKMEMKKMEMKKMKLRFAEGECNHFVLAHAPEVLWEAIMS